MRPFAWRRNIYCMPNFEKKDAREKHADEIIVASTISLSLQRNNKYFASIGLASLVLLMGRNVGTSV